MKLKKWKHGLFQQIKHMKLIHNFVPQTVLKKTEAKLFAIDFVKKKKKTEHNFVPYIMLK